MPLNEKDIKNALTTLISSAIDEESLPIENSFVEMNDDVIHCAIEDRDWYFQVALTRVDG